MARILVLGAGIGGLSAALALLRRGFDVEVYEQASELREVGAGVQISPNGTRALYGLGVGEAMQALACEPVGKEVRLWSTGQTWKLFDLGTESIQRYGFPYFTVYRADLHAVLADGVRRAKPDAIRLGARCTDVTQDDTGVTLRFDGGRTARGDALIAADGIRSKVRELFVGADRAEFSGIVAWRGVIPMERLPERLRKPVGTNWIGPGGHCIHYPLRAGQLMNFVGYVERQDWREEGWNIPGTNAEYAADFRGWHEDIHTFIRCVPQPFKWALLVRPPLERWTFARVTLLGDAAHPTLPFLAQGAAQAIEDGYVLARALEACDGDLEKGLQRYEAARRERTNRMVRGSAENTKRFHNPLLSDPAEAQKYVDREWEEKRITERYDWLFTYDVDTVPV